MLRAYRNWDFPKGVLEPGEEPLAAARREVREETLINDLQFTWGEEYRETAPYSNNKVARYYVAVTHTEHVTLPVSPELGRPEHNRRNSRRGKRQRARQIQPARFIVLRPSQLGAHR